MSIPEKQWEVRLAKHVEDDLTLEHFDVVEVAVPEPGDGEVLVRVDYVSVAAAFKEFMRSDCQIPGVPPWKVGDPAGGGGVGTVVKSNSPDLEVGDLVQSFGAVAGVLGRAGAAVHQAEPALRARARSTSCRRDRRRTTAWRPSRRPARATSCSSPVPPVVSARWPGRSRRPVAPR